MDLVDWIKDAKTVDTKVFAIGEPVYELPNGITIRRCTICPDIRTKWDCETKELFVICGSDGKQIDNNVFSRKWYSNALFAGNREYVMLQQLSFQETQQPELSERVRFIEYFEAVIGYMGNVVWRAKSYADEAYPLTYRVFKTKRDILFSYKGEELCEVKKTIVANDVIIATVRNSPDSSIKVIDAMGNMHSIEDVLNRAEIVHKIQ